MQITIRKITEADVATLSALAKQTFYDTFTGTCTVEDMQSFLEQYFSEEQLAREIGDENNNYFFAELNGIPVGYLQFAEDYSGFPLMKQWKALELKRIYVGAAYHGKGIADKLMDCFFDHARKHSYEAAWLGVWEHNIRAQRFYEKYGFVNSGHPHDFPIGNTPQTDFWFWKFLQN